MCFWFFWTPQTIHIQRQDNSSDAFCPPMAVIRENKSLTSIMRSSRLLGNQFGMKKLSGSCNGSNSKSTVNHV